MSYIEAPEAQTVDFNTHFPDQDFSQEPVRIPAPKPCPPTQAKTDDEPLLDLSDDATLDKLSTSGFQRIRPEGQNVISVAFSKPAVLLQTHFSQERNKTFRCLQPSSSLCCEKLGEPRDVIGVLAVQYCGASTKDGSFKRGTDPDLRVGYVTLSTANLAMIRQGVQEGATLYDHDWKISKKTNGIGYDYLFQRATPLYKTLNLQHEVEKLIAPYKDGTKLRKRVAKPLSLLEVKSLLSGEAAELDEGNHLEDMDTL